MSEMVERVARALCVGNPDELVRMPAVPSVVGYPKGHTPAVALKPRDPVARWTLHVSDARAAIAAMREPTEAMDKAGENVEGVYCGPEETTRGCDHLEVWNAMINAALAD